MQKTLVNRCIVCWASGNKSKLPDALNIHEI